MEVTNDYCCTFKKWEELDDVGVNGSFREIEVEKTFFDDLCMWVYDTFRHYYFDIVTEEYFKPFY